MTEPPRTDITAPVPKHVAIIMDGNGRWAKKRGLPRLKGHQAGAENIRPVIKYLAQQQVQYLTLYAFSTENWNRPEEEVKGLFRLLSESINSYMKEAHQNNIKVCHLGSLEGLPLRLQSAIGRAVELTKNNTGMTLCFALNYGGRQEIIHAARQIVSAGVPPQNIDAELFSRYLYTAGIPDVDLLIRTGGEYRISNFLLWQAAYSELYFTDVFWPDFNETEMEKALLAYSQRQRRFGGL
jgi:undecaprenyl diphosphate synthase